MMELLSEAYVFAEKAGLPSHTLEALIQENYGVYAYGISTRLTTGAYIPPRGKAFELPHRTRKLTTTHNI